MACAVLVVIGFLGFPVSKPDTKARISLQIRSHVTISRAFQLGFTAIAAVRSTCNSALEDAFVLLELSVLLMQRKCVSTAAIQTVRAIAFSKKEGKRL
jgi:hypothetical protein